MISGSRPLRRHLFELLFVNYHKQLLRADVGRHFESKVFSQKQEVANTHHRGLHQRVDIGLTLFMLRLIDPK